MKLNNENAVFFVPCGESEDIALSRTTDLCITAHQDDIEFWAFCAISACKKDNCRFFTGVTVADGAGSPRSGKFANMTDEDMKRIRINEQNEAAKIGKYSAQLQLGYSSKAIKDSKNTALIGELAGIIEKASPKTLYIHNLADKHDTHVAVSLRVIEALNSLPKEKWPEKIIALEGWRDLDWLSDDEKVLFDCADEELFLKLVSVYESQIAGGKRYDVASVGRRRANATFLSSHSVDVYESVSYGMDITDELKKGSSPLEIIISAVERFKADVSKRIEKLS
ncbi:MAG: PIG-L family deacetylase [Clostridia bacterium]|nr:PIG-L family deacetylase [Clostridia bacterium]